MKFCVIFLLMIAGMASAQPPAVLWQQHYGGNGIDEADAVIQTADGGFLIAGSTRSSTASPENIYLVRINGDGAMQWTRTFGGAESDRACDVLQTTDGGFVIAATTESYGNGCTNVYLLRLNSAGDSVWAHTYGSNSCETAYTLVATTDGGYLLGGSVVPGLSGGSDFLLVKTNSSGVQQWLRTFGTAGNDVLYDLTPAGDGGFYGAGETSENASADFDQAVFKINASGDTLWLRSSGGSADDGARFAAAMPGGCVAGGYSWSFDGMDFYASGWSSNGSLDWCQTETHLSAARAEDGLRTFDGGVLTVGSMRVDSLLTLDMAAVKLSSDGAIEWLTHFGGQRDETALAVCQNSDSGFTIAGFTDSLGNNRDIFVVRTAPACQPTFTGLAMNMDTLRLYEGWKWYGSFPVAVTTCSTYAVPNNFAAWSSGNTAIATVDSLGRIIAQSAGTTQITATYHGHSAHTTVIVQTPVLPMVHETIPQFLATPAAGALWEVPVVIIRFLPTADGVNLDVGWAPDFWDLGRTTLADLTRRIDDNDRRVKFMVEEGSKFRGYDNPNALPSLGYRVVDYLTIYEPLPPGPIINYSLGYPLYGADYHQLFQRLNAEHYVNDLGVKEFWIWCGVVNPGFPCLDPAIHTPDRFRYGWESNMSSPTTGDISNSNLDNTDLPIYNSTYIVIEQNLRSNQASALHNRGHQFESIIYYINERQDHNHTLFYDQFVGLYPDGFRTGHCGNTHFPANAEHDYDYWNPRGVTSDIRHWQPSGGPTTTVSLSTWADHPYAWPDENWADVPSREEAHWYLYWMQSMPGRDNNIPHGDSVMTNWWALTARWDSVVTAGMGLYGPRPPAKPVAVTARRIGNDVVLRWKRNGNPRTVGYEVFRSDSMNSGFISAGQVSDTVFTDVNAVLTSDRHYYYVTAHSDERAYSAARASQPLPHLPVQVDCERRSRQRRE